MTERYFKFLDAAGSGQHSGFAWPLPKGDDPGAWVEAAGALVACENGLHAARAGDCLAWLDETAYELEYDGEVLDGVDKVLGRKARLTRRLAWDERTKRLFACDCAERVLPLYERAVPGDARPREAIAVARRFANGAATREELAAARAAASAAASAAAWYAAGAAERAWQTATLVAYLDGAAVGGALGTMSEEA